MSEKPNGRTPNGNAPSVPPNPLTRIGEALKPLQELCRDPKPAAAMRTFAELLIDLPAEHIGKAVLRYLNQADELWFPSPAKLRKLAMEAEAGELPEWHHAWHRIMEAARMWDQHEPEKAVAARQHVGEVLFAFVRMLGGFVALSCVNPETLSVLQSNFRQSFTNERNRVMRNRALPESLRPGLALLESNAPRRLPGKTDDPIQTL
jgi:hypothetical protein